MKPPYQITDEILQLIVSISEKLGEIKSTHLHKPPTKLRKKNRIKTIQSSLEIEGNTLTEEQITAILENKKVIAPQKDIIEVQNAIKVYEQLRSFNPYQIQDLEKAHAILMHQLLDNAGKLRTKNVGIVKGEKIEHIAPSGTMVKGLMNDLFDYLQNDEEILLVKSCVFHYEFEFIHPFLDGNGRMGRFWQTLILMQKYPVFEYLPLENIIKKNQNAYYEALSKSDKMGQSTPFIAFMLNVIFEALNDLLQSQNRTLSAEERILIFQDVIKDKIFSRKDYLSNYKEISTATASRDLKNAVKQNILVKFGENRLTKYQFKKV